jgi:Soluble lytic murein transglycosylase and related regulatory proteins (some contain LysM/invasin domains)
MAKIRILGQGTVLACAVTSLLAGCSSVERETKLASNAPAAGAQNTASGPQLAQMQTTGTGAQTTVTLSKTGRLPIAVPTEAEVATAQDQAIAAPEMAAQVALADPAADATTQQVAQAPAAAPATSTLVASAQAAPVADWHAPATSTILAASRQQPSSTAKVGRLVSTDVAPGVAEGKIQPAAAAAIALDEPELTPDMVALQRVVPTPRPDRPTITAASARAPSSATLAYASAPHAVASLKAMEFPPAPDPLPASAANATPELMKLIKRYSGLYGVPESLVHRVVHRESKYDPSAYNKNGYWGLMQISYPTAKSMGYEGPASGLLDAETNLKYAIKYLRGAWLVADNKNDHAIKLYARGYYHDAKRKDMLHVLEK